MILNLPSFNCVWRIFIYDLGKFYTNQRCMNDAFQYRSHTLDTHAYGELL